MEINNKITIIGPRLTELAGYSNASVNNELMSLIGNTLLKHPKSSLITSATVGIELWSALLAMEGKVPIILVVPCADYDSKWPRETKKEYAKVKSKATQIIELSKEPWSYKLVLAKDKYISEQSNLIYHFYNILPRFLNKDKCFSLLRDTNHEYFINF